jgi:hypothetical protein
VSGYPPEPWGLRGQLHAAVFVVPRHEVPVDVPAGCRLVQVGGRVVVTTAWVDYEPGGVLSYRELMATVLVRRGARPMPTITHIWVDSVASRDGGRALWGIPKELAAFELDGPGWQAADDHGVLARGTVRQRWRLPGRWPLRFAVAQWLDGRVKVSPVRASAAIALDRAEFAADAAGPLAFLAGRRPLLAVSVLDFRMSFGG